MPAQRNPPRSLPPPPARDWALFLDVDGCLLDFADTPDSVSVPHGLRELLTELSQRLDGALALVSGRALAQIDALFRPLVLPAAGLHGLERRHDVEHVALAAPPALAAIIDEARTVVATWPGCLVEDKGAALALHWRAEPRAASTMHAFAEAALPRLPGYRVQHGNHVVELRPANGDKGAAILAMLAQPPFRGRTPVFAGDDLTDESGFAVVNAHAGISILVGDRTPSAAHFGLRDPEAVRSWLATATKGDA